MNPHRTRNHGSIEHRESIKRMLDKTKRDNRVKVLRGKLQKMANVGIDWEGMARKHATPLTHKEHKTISWVSPSGVFYDAQEFGGMEHRDWVKTLFEKSGDKKSLEYYKNENSTPTPQGDIPGEVADMMWAEDSGFTRINTYGGGELDISTGQEPTKAQNKAIQDLAISRGYKSEDIVLDGLDSTDSEQTQLRRRMGLTKLGKLKVRAQKMAGLQKIAYAGIHSAKPVMDAFKNKKPLRFGEKPKGKKTEYAFQTDGKILYQSGYPIAEHTKNGIKFSYQGHPTATTSDTARYLGIDTFTKKGVTYINGEVVDPYGFDYVEVPWSNISDTPVKVNPKSKPIINEQTKQKNRDQEAFRIKAEKEAVEGNQDLVVQTKTKKEPLDHGSITKAEQKGIKKITGLGKDVDETFATTYHHSLPAEEGGGIGGGVINRRMTGGAVPLSRKTHYEAHFPEKTIPKSFYKKISQLQGKLQKIAETDPYKRVIGKPGINRKEELQKDDGLPPKSYAMFDEDFAEGIPDSRVETFSGSPDSKIIEKKDVEDNPKRYTLDDIGKRGSEAINTDKGLFEKGESELSRKLEDLRINRISIKETGIRENLGDLIKRKYIPKYMREKSNEPKVSGISQGVITTDLAKRLAKLQKIATVNKNALGNNTMEEIGSYDWNTGKKLNIEQIHALGNGSDVFAVAVTKGLNKNSDFRIPEEYINKDFGVKKIGLVKGIYENEEGLIEHDRTYLFHGSDDEVQRQLNLHNDINKGVTQEAAGRIYKDKKGIVQYENIPNKQFKKSK